MALKLWRRDGRGNFVIRGTDINGKEINQSTKTTDEKVAKSLLIKFEAKGLTEAVHGPASTKTFEDAVQSYLETGGRTREGGSPRFIGEFDPKTGKWDRLMGVFKDRVLNTITQSELDKTAISLYPDCSADTRNRQCHAVFIAIWNHAHGDGWCERRDWRRPKEAKGTLARHSRRAGTTAVSYDRAWQFVRAMSPAPAMLMTTFFYTGMRPIELFTLDDTQVNVDGRWITLPASKTGEPRGVPMHDVLVPLMTALKARGGVLFRTSRDTPYQAHDEDELNPCGGQMKTAIIGARRRSGITEIAPYTGRHTVSTQLVLNGVHPFVKDQIIGHVKTDMSHNYTQIPIPPLIEAIQTLPVIAEWAAAPWLHDPIAWQCKLAAGTGQRNDLIRAAA